MTNAEKYEEVFGMHVDPSMCPTTDCNNCPCASKDAEGCISCVAACTYEFWKDDYPERPQKPHCNQIDLDKSYDAGYVNGYKVGYIDGSKGVKYEDHD